eukprot:gene1804-2933_t
MDQPCHFSDLGSQIVSHPRCHTNLAGIQLSNSCRIATKVWRTRNSALVTACSGRVSTRCTVSDHLCGSNYGGRRLAGRALLVPSRTTSKGCPTAVAVSAVRCASPTVPICAARSDMLHMEGRLADLKAAATATLASSSDGGAAPEWFCPPTSASEADAQADAAAVALRATRADICAQTVADLELLYPVPSAADPLVSVEPSNGPAGHGMSTIVFSPPSLPSPSQKPAPVPKTPSPVLLSQPPPLYPQSPQSLAPPPAPGDLPALTLPPSQPPCRSPRSDRGSSIPSTPRTLGLDVRTLESCLWFLVHALQALAQVLAVPLPYKLLIQSSQSAQEDICSITGCMLAVPPAVHENPLLASM